MDAFKYYPLSINVLNLHLKHSLLSLKGALKSILLTRVFITILYSISVRQYSQPFSICGLFLRLKQFVGTPRAFHSTQGFRSTPVDNHSVGVTCRGFIQLFSQTADDPMTKETTPKGTTQDLEHFIFTEPFLKY